MPKYDIPDQVHKNLIVFLRRTKLEGFEVPEFNLVMQSLSVPIVEDKDKKEENKQ